MFMEECLFYHPVGDWANKKRPVAAGAETPTTLEVICKFWDLTATDVFEWGAETPQ